MHSSGLLRFRLPSGFQSCLLTAAALLTVAPGSAQNTPSYLIATAAGSGAAYTPPLFGGSGPPVGDGGPATQAILYQPTSVAVSTAGDLYVCDWTARIRKVDHRTGLITTIAGTGETGFAGDGGPATNALLGGPGSVAVDTAGNVYFADPYNHRVRRISAATGIITTVAGNGFQFSSGPQSSLAIDASIGIPSGVAVDAQGDLYIANGANAVWKVAAGTGILSTVAGGGASAHSGDGGPAAKAQVDQPEGLALDAAGNLYIAARGENRIRKVDAATGIITTIAGGGSGVNSMMGVVYPGQFGGDGGPATSAFLNDPEGVAVDAAGNVYISDTMNYRVRRIDAATGIIHTIAGTGAKGFSGDNGLAMNAQITDPAGLIADSAGRVYFADLFNQRVRVLVPLPPVQTPAIRLPRRISR
jgi:sugar lactone lactonase YvrE